MTTEYPSVPVQSTESAIERRHRHDSPTEKLHLDACPICREQSIYVYLVGGVWMCSTCQIERA